jgi:hypothetical protein
VALRQSPHERCALEVSGFAPDADFFRRRPRLGLRRARRRHFGPKALRTSSASSSAGMSIIATPFSLKRIRNVVRSMPASNAACPGESRFISNSFTAMARRASCSNSAGVWWRASGNVDGYSMCIDRFMMEGYLFGVCRVIRLLSGRGRAEDPAWRLHRVPESK